MLQINQESSDRAGGHFWKVRHKMFRYFVQKRGTQWALRAVVLRLYFQPIGIPERSQARAFNDVFIQNKTALSIKLHKNRALAQTLQRHILENHCKVHIRNEGIHISVHSKHSAHAITV